MSTITQTSIAPMTSETFWINYSNLLLSVWSIPDLKNSLKARPAEVLAYFDLATVPGSTIEIKDQIAEGEGSFDDQYDLFIEGHKNRNYVFYVPKTHPGTAVRGASDLAAAAEGSSACCCCTCCPCCSCF
jgi:hypothetical protein